MTRGTVFAIMSAAAHLALLGVVFLGGSAPAHSPDDDLVDVSIEPALGQPHGAMDGKGLGSHIESFVPPEHRAAPRQAAPTPPPTDPDGPPVPIASASAASSAEPASSAPPAPDSSAAAAAAPGASAGDPSTPVGSANVAPGIGSPDGSENGTGVAPPKPKMTSVYAGVLAGWFGSRFNVRGLGLSPEELKKLSVRVSISISPDRRVTGFSLAGTSGHAGYDEEVRRTVASIQASGVSLPEPPDGSTPPENFTVRFRPLVIH